MFFKKINKFRNYKFLFKVNRRTMIDFDPTKDYYKMLSLNSNATEKEIKEAYHKMARKYHPDLNQGKTTETFKEITSAYDILSDPTKRRDYDSYRYSGINHPNPQEESRRNPFNFNQNQWESNYQKKENMNGFDKNANDFF